MLFSTGGVAKAVLARHTFPVVVSAVVLLVGLYWSARWPLWQDEIYTYHVLQGGGLADLWQRLKTGPQSDPPLFYLAARASVAVFGDNTVAFRLPGTVGILTMALAVYALVARNGPPVYGRLAMLLALFPPVLSHLANARPYGLWLGWSGLALFCWQGAGDWRGGKRGAALLGLACCGAASVATHYYAVLFLAALAGAELFRSWWLRRVSLSVWLTFVPAVLALVALAPLIENCKSFIEGSWAAPDWFSSRHSLRGVLFRLFASIFHLPLYAAIFWVARRYRTAEKPTTTAGLPVPLLAAAAAVSAIPLLGFLLALAYTKNYTIRYVLPAVCGLAILVPLVAQRVLRGRARPARLLVVLSIFLAVSGAAVVGIKGPPLTPSRVRRDIPDVHERAGEANSFFVTNSLGTFIEAKFTHPETRLVFVCLRQTLSMNVVARRLKHWYPDIMELEDLYQFDRLLLAGEVSGTLIQSLRKRQAPLEARPDLRSGKKVYEVTGGSLVKHLYDSPTAVRSRSVRETPPGTK